MQMKTRIAGLLFGLGALLGVIDAKAQTNPGFNPNLQWCGVQGSVAIRGASNWQCLLPGTNGQVLLSGGAGANPSWSTVTGTGTVTSVSGSGGTTGLTLTGGPITGAGTLTLGGTLALANGGTGGVGAANTVLTSNGTANSFAQVANAMIASSAVTDSKISLSTINVNKMASIPALSVIANATGGAAVPTTPTVTALLDAAFSNTQGSVLYRNAAGWSALGPGTNGQFLMTSGAAANPAWQTVTGGNIGSIPNGTVLANISGSSGSPTNPTTSQLLDATMGSTQGMLLFRNATTWTTLAPGLVGTLLQSGGAGDPSWTTLGQIRGTATNNNAAAGYIGEEISSNRPIASVGNAAINTAFVVNSISLTAGDWDISSIGYLSAANGQSVTGLRCLLTTGTTIPGIDSPLGALYGVPYTQGAGSWYISLVVPPSRISLASTTTYNQVCDVTGSGAGNGAFFGNLRARRMR